MSLFNRFLSKSSVEAIKYIRPTTISTRQFTNGSNKFSTLLNKNQFNPNRYALYSSTIMGVRFNSTQVEPLVVPLESAAPASEIAANALSHPALQLGDLKAMGLVNWTPVGALEGFMEMVNVFSGLPWWGTIALTTFIIRVAMLPIIVKLQKASARFHNVKPEMELITRKLNRAKESQDPIAMQAASSEMMTMYKKNDINPFKILALPFLQAPVMVSFFIGLRNMAELPVPQFLDGGLFWFTNLAVADPTWMLPICSSLGFLAIYELGSELGKSGMSQQTAGMKYFFRFMIPIMTYFTMDLPAAVHLYWVCSNIFSMGQILTFNQPAVRSYFNIPQLKKHPLRVHDTASPSIFSSKKK